ncbi:hypothetical protein FCS83_09855 [Oenococcus sp. UCMA 17063]|nr:hypothetical protein [Oenococcus sp. UCMA 17063]
MAIKVVAYTDGSRLSASDKYGYSFIAVDENEKNILYQASGSGNKAEYLVSKQIAGETLAVLAAINWAISFGADQILIKYDYEGLEKWTNGSWKANKIVAKDYKSELEILKQRIQIDFQKVKAHSGDKFNDQVDKAAKIAQLESFDRQNSDGSHTLTGISENNDLTLTDIINQINQTNLIKVTKKSSNDISESYTLMIKQTQKKCRFTYFKTVSKILIQGQRESAPVRIAVEYLSNLLSSPNSLMNNLSSIDVQSSLNKIEYEKRLKELLPNYKTENDLYETVLLQIVRFHDYPDTEEFDYSFMCFPSFRISNYYLWKILETYITDGSIQNYRNSSGFRNFGSVLDNTNHGCLMTNVRAKIVNSQVITIWENLYQFYSNRRSQYSHLDTDDQNFRNINDIQEARGIIDESLNIFNKVYAII